MIGRETSMKIPLTKGKFAIVDKDDYVLLSRWSWMCTSNGYAMRLASCGVCEGKRIRKAVYMHRVINNTSKDKATDHRNGDKLDNRRENLRDANNSQNQMNTKIFKKHTSLYRGVRKTNRRNP